MYNDKIITIVLGYKKYCLKNVFAINSTSVKFSDLLSTNIWMKLIVNQIGLPLNILMPILELADKVHLAEGQFDTYLLKCRLKITSFNHKISTKTTITVVSTL
jgi:hypothetical protein